MISQNGSVKSQDSNIVVLNNEQQLNASNQSNNNFNNSASSNNSNSNEYLNSMTLNPPSESTCTIVDDDYFATANDLFM